MRDLKHLIYFESLLQEANNELVKQACSEGKLALAYNCSYIPEPLLDIDGCFSVRLRAPGCVNPDLATYYMTNRSCPYSKSILERAFEGGYNFISALVGQECCTTMNRMEQYFEYCKLIPNEKFFVCCIDMPTKKGEWYAGYFRRQIEKKIIAPMKEVYGVDFSDEKILDAIERHNELCRIITEIGDFRKLDNPPITGYEFHVIDLVTYVCPKALILPYLRETLAELKKRKPDHFAVRQYAKFKLSAGKTAKSILISCGARLAVFDIAELREVTSYDELELDTLGDRKTALFLIMSDTDDSFNFLISMCYTQLFNLLCEKADDVYGGRLPVHVRCLIDECANIGQIPKLEKLVATIRSREISACLVLQAQSQLKAIYKDNADTIIGNMDTSIFLGGKEPTTLKELAAVLGKETIDTYNTGESRGRETSHSLNYQKLGKELMSQDELAVMDGGKCILQLRGVRPFLSDKYDITKHPNFKYTADASDKNAFDIEAFLSTRLKLKPNEVCDVYEVDTEGA